MKKPKAYDPWEDKTNWEPASCNVCVSCLRHKLNGRCIYGGPYKGYAKVIYDDIKKG